MSTPTFTVSVIDFKELFYRDFTYLSTWENFLIYNIDDNVYYHLTNQAYICKNNGVTSFPTEITDWDVDINGIKERVLDRDIEKAFKEADILYNTDYLSNDEERKLAYLYLTAHYLVFDMNMEGVDDDGQAGVLASKSVRDVSLSYTLGQWASNTPVYSLLMKTAYGQKYLSLIYTKAQFSRFFMINEGYTI